jgi:micrococcal nuclease
VSARACLVGAAGLCLAAALAGCGGEVCGPSTGIVTAVADGDTITLQSGDKVRYLMVDAPEATSKIECYGKEAADFNRQLVLGQTIELRYDAICRDRFERLLAWVSVGGREVNSLLVERGYACVLHIPPNGDNRVVEFEALQQQARDENRGLWGYCSTRPC